MTDWIVASRMGVKIYKTLMIRFELGNCVQIEHALTTDVRLISIFESAKGLIHQYKVRF